MSNLQEIPLAEPEGLEVASSDVTPTPKSNSLKRFFKISKKPLMRDQAEDVSESSSSEDPKELGKSNTISRFFTRKKGASKDVPEQSSSIADPEEQEKPQPNVKPTIKTSISSYWKILFHRQKGQRQNADFGPSNSAGNDPEEVHEMQPVPQESEHELQSDVKVEQSDIEEYSTDPEPPQPMPKKNLANKASGEEILSALEGGQLSSVELEDGESGQPSPVIVNQFN
ncbi:uncharacterized protein LOC128257008 [Drosophila gunungcola]|uniref:uncharacterized protein LOC128257008 n=1 Tax=Drosophila gunungcola TaxID=103775 RepID=UPI0022DF3A26|nr:uncharacterized protein LOC128257008 [Drosophila gunungcola]